MRYVKNQYQPMMLVLTTEMEKPMIMRNILTLIFFCSFFNIHAQGDWYDRGMAEYEMMKYADAAQSFQNHIQTNPSDKKALLKLAECYDYVYDWDNAARWYYEALGHSVSTEFLLKHGMIQMRLARYEAAKEQFLIYSNVNKTVGDHYARMCDYAYNKKSIPSLFQVDKLELNSSHSEHSPTFFNDDLIYVSSRKDIMRPDATNGAISANDPKYNFVFKANMSGMEQPDYVRSWFHDNNLINEGPISYSRDGRWVAFVDNKYVDGISMMAHHLFRGDIFIAQVNGNGDWESAAPFPYNGNFSNNFPHLSEDGNTLYFSSDRPGGEGGYDIYMSVKKNGAWTQPVNMGPTINKPGNEISPFIDQKDFYFSSDYHIGFGGQDVFKANYHEGIWKIQNLGTGVNTSANDFDFIYSKDKNIGYLTSDREQGEDIYKVIKTSDDINIVVLDAITKIPVGEASLDFKNCGKEVFRTNANGRFGFKASMNLDCWVDVSKSGYERSRLDLDQDSKSRGLIEVLLFKQGEMYKGKVTDGMNDFNISEARIKVLNQTNGQKYEVYSDGDGIYTLSLEPRSTYLIQYSKMGYVGVGTRIETGDGTDKGILGSQLLFPTSSDGTIPSTPTVPSPPTVDAGPPSVPSPPKPPVTTPSPPRPPVITPTVPTTPNTPAQTEVGFSVQLMSLSKGNPNFPAKVKSLKGMVQRIYSKTDDKWKKYRVGTYATREEAENVKRYIRSVGFESAFVVEEDAKGVIEEIRL